MKICKIYLVHILVMGSMFFSCSRSKQDLYDRIPKIDAHVHIRTEDPSIMEFAKSQGFTFITINTRSDNQEHIDMQMRYAKLIARAYPDHLSYITTFSMENFEEPGWEARVIRKLQEDFDQGAIGVKVWKDIGMTFRDSLGDFIFFDDPRFDHILDFIAGQGKPMVAHIGEPKNCWLPVDSMTVNNDKSYFQNHPEYHMYLHPEFPSYERLVESRDQVLAKHPDLKLIGAHLGSLEWDVDELAKRLDQFPNFAVDMAARVCHFQVQDRDKIRDFILKYQDRLLYATDLIVSEDSEFEALKVRLENEWRSDWNYFAGDSTMNSDKVDGEFKGLALDEDVLRKIYYSNALQWYPK